jgi:SH3-like domain-containing protein
MLIETVEIRKELSVRFGYNVLTQELDNTVFVQEVKVKNAPLENAEDDFLLHEGTKVQVLDQLDLWRKIKIIDGSQGWVTSKSIKELK